MLWLSVAFMLAGDIPDTTHTRAHDRTQECERDVHKNVSSISESLPSVDSRPTLFLDVVTSPGIPRHIVDRVLSEAVTIWETVGIDIERSSIRTGNGQVDRTATDDPRAITVVMDDEPKTALNNDPALGWIVFDGPDQPERRIHLSRRSATVLLDAVSGFAKRPEGERERLIGRALGRTLAHELGHYLLGSKEHTRQGLMRATVTAGDFFSPSRASFYLECEQVTLATRRLTSHPRIVRRGTVDGWNLGAHRAEIARQLPAVMNGVEQEPEKHVSE
jgi:hypothetical protein